MVIITQEQAVLKLKLPLSLKKPNRYNKQSSAQVCKSQPAAKKNLTAASAGALVVRWKYDDLN